jgi:hypothetical protein
MFTQVRYFDVTIPAGTPKASPLVSLIQFAPRVVTRIDWLFPHGCQGLVGIQIGARGIPVIPGSIGQFIVRSGDSAGVNLEGMHETGDWSVIGYNTGSFSHTVHLTFITHAIPPPVDDKFIVGDVGDILSMGES